MTGFSGTKCDGCGKQVEEASPRDWLRSMLTVLGKHTASAEQVDFCSNSCGMTFWTRRVDNEQPA
jgi:hypothetical protein